MVNRRDFSLAMVAGAVASAISSRNMAATPAPVRKRRRMPSISVRFARFPMAMPIRGPARR